MDNNQVQQQSSPLHAKPEWLKRFLKECEYEGDAFLIMGSRMLKQTARNIVWYITDKLKCHENGVPGQACRIVEWFIVHKIRNQPDLRKPEVRKMILDYMSGKMLLIVACSVLLAAKMNSAELSVTAPETCFLLGLKGFRCKVPEVLGMEMNILASIDFHVPLTTSVEVGEMLARELKVEPNVIPAVAKTIDQAELYRYDVEASLRQMTKSRGINNSAVRVLTLHLAAGGVAAALKTASTQQGVSQSLAGMLQVSTEYMKCIRDVILAEIAKERVIDEDPLASLQRKRKSPGGTPSRADSPRPSTSKRY